MDAETIKTQVQREFGARAEAYVQSAGHAQGDDLARLVELAAPEPQMDALDVATGGGHTALAFARHVRSVVASDLTQAMLDSAAAFIQKQGVTNVRFAIADAEALPFPDASFDLVTCRIAPHHFPNVTQAVQEWARVLKPGGHMLLEDSVVPDDPELDEFINMLEGIRDYTHVRSYTEREWQDFFEAAGLRVLHSELWHKTHPFRDWMERGAMRNRFEDWPRVEQMLTSASPKIQGAFKITYAADGTPTSFADEKLILLAEKIA